VFHYDRSLARLGGDPALFAEVARLFLEDSPGLLEAAKSGLRQPNCDELARAAHSLKNLSATFDADELTQAASAVEQLAHDGDRAGAAECFSDLERELARLQQALAEYSGQRGSS
jgi:HPt (histidine-containing phosphotransfer) domain-containing protein